MISNKTIRFFIVSVFSWIIAHYLYNKYVKLGLNTIEVNLKHLCVEHTAGSVYIFTFENRKMTIIDTHNKIEKMYASKKLLKEKLIFKLKEEKRYFFINEGVILKTDNDSIDVMKNEEKLHGYMGVWQQNNCYYVDENATFKRCK